MRTAILSVLVVAAALGGFVAGRGAAPDPDTPSDAAGTASDGGPPAYEISARFANVGSLDPGAPVRLSGVRVGTVSGIEIDASTYDAVVRMAIDREAAPIPIDTAASVLSAGLLGDLYVGLDAGGEESRLRDGDEIRITQSAIILEQVIGQFLYNRAPEGWGGN